MKKRFPPKRILVPIDFSPASRSALRAATALAQGFKARLKLVHVREIEPAPGPETGRALVAMQIIRRKDPRLLKRLRSRLLALAEGSKGRATARAFFGVPAHALPPLASPLVADLVVMGAHGVHGLRRAVRGSVVEAVMRRGQLPVLALRPGRRPDRFRSILCPFNLEAYSVPALRYAAQLARGLGAELTVLYVPPGSLRKNEAQRRLAREVERALGRDAQGLRLRIAQEDKPLNALVRLLRRGGFDLVVMAEHERFWKLLGTTAERLLRRSPIALLSVPSPRPARAAIIF
jgi:nucleotide-binding universal stress UspA family protein